jgi:hypothetical protein
MWSVSVVPVQSVPSVLCVATAPCAVKEASAANVVLVPVLALRRIQRMLSNICFL